VRHLSEGAMQVRDVMLKQVTVAVVEFATSSGDREKKNADVRRRLSTAQMDDVASLGFWQIDHS